MEQQELKTSAAKDFLELAISKGFDLDSCLIDAEDGLDFIAWNEGDDVKPNKIYNMILLVNQEEDGGTEILVITSLNPTDRDKVLDNINLMNSSEDNIFGTCFYLDDKDFSVKGRTTLSDSHKNMTKEEWFELVVDVFIFTKGLMALV